MSLPFHSDEVEQSKSASMTVSSGLRRRRSGLPVTQMFRRTIAMLEARFAFLAVELTIW